jgi:hypothetical protein
MGRLQAGHRREGQRHAQGHRHGDADAPEHVGQRVHRLDQARDGDGERAAAGQAGDDEPGARGDGRDPDGQHGGQGRRGRHRGVTRREQERRIALPLTVHEPFEQDLHGQGGGERHEGEHHQVPPLDPPAEDGTSQHRQEHHRLQGGGDDRRQPAGAGGDQLLPVHHPRVDRVEPRGVPDQRRQEAPGQEGGEGDGGRPRRGERQRAVPTGLATICG